MPFVYVYSPSDFVGGLPDEQGAMAAGSGTFTLTLVDGARPTLMEVNDDDRLFDEVDPQQMIAQDLNLDGTNYSAGTTVNTAYDLINTGSGHKVTTLHFGGNGYEQGAVHGLISTEELRPGQSYRFNLERTSHRQQTNTYDSYVACFTAGTRIQTPRGLVRIEDLSSGDAVITEDGTKELSLVLSQVVNAERIARNPKLRPVRITAGALGRGKPERDLLVSPQHRMLVTSNLSERVTGERVALIPAHRLTELPGIYIEDPKGDLKYVHLVFEAHEIVFAEGAPSESFYPGEQAVAGLPDAAREELFGLFPSLADGFVQPETARSLPSAHVQRKLISRHVANDQQLLQPT